MTTEADLSAAADDPMNNTDSTDRLQKFMIDAANTRGELVELSHAWRQVLSRRNYPAPVQRVLGELMAAAALLSANLKFEGVIVMQIHGDGPVQLLVIECDASLHMRATAKLRDPEADIPDTGLQDLVNKNGKGKFVVTLDPKDKSMGQQAYQGVIPLEGDSVAGAIENYMLRSEQLDTRLWLAADGHTCRGLLLQRLPDHGGTILSTNDGTELKEEWAYLAMLGDTLSHDEILKTDIDTLLHRLFWEQDLRSFAPEHPEFYCTCSREKVGNMLKMLGVKEVEATIRDVGTVAVDCDFCGMHYEFDPIDCAQLFSETPSIPLPVVDSSVKH